LNRLKTDWILSIARSTGELSSVVNFLAGTINGQEAGTR
jgi:hypothetical protein